MPRIKKVVERILSRIIDVTIDYSAFDQGFIEDGERPNELQKEWRRIIDEEIDWMGANPIFLPDGSDMLYDREFGE